MIIDIFSYAGEADILELRLNILDPYVDQFIICESPLTFSGTLKPLHYIEHQARFAKWKDKIKYFILDGNWEPEELMQADSSPNTQCPSLIEHARWMEEFLQKEALKKAMTHLKDDDICFIGDVDEIWDPLLVKVESSNVIKLKLRVYSYYLNMRSNEQFWGPIRVKYGDMKGECLNHLRNNGPNNSDLYWGWHFTSQGGLEAVKKKLDDQYNESIFNGESARMLPERFGKVDYIGRNFKFDIDESEWPQFLKDNREKYKHLLYEEPREYSTTT